MTSEASLYTNPDHDIPKYTKNQLAKLRDEMYGEAEALAIQANELEDKAYHIETEDELGASERYSRAALLFAQAEAFRRAGLFVEAMW